MTFEEREMEMKMGNFKTRIMSFIMAVTFILTSFVYPDLPLKSKQMHN